MDALTAILTTATLAATIRAATPIALAALGGIFSERGGVINIGLEGMMLSGAFAAVGFSYWSSALGLPDLVCVMIGVIAALVLSTLVAAIHAFVTIKLRADQVVSGVAINILALGVSGLLLERLFNVTGNSPAVPDMGTMPIPILKDIPFLGEVLFNHQPIVYLMLIAVPVSAYTISRTKFGLRLRAVGEKPDAIDTVGVNVHRLRFTGVALSGLLAGLAGVYLSLGQLNFFGENMTAGRGFIALAAVIFGNWRPWGAFGAALLFGFADAAQIALQNSGVAIPSDFLLMLPYVVTLVALAGFVGESRPPEAIGVPYPVEETT